MSSSALKAPTTVAANILADYAARKIGASSAGTVALGATAVQLINPASNVNGAIVRTAALYTVSNWDSALYSGTSAPSSASDMTKPLLLFILHAQGTIMLPAQIYLPPGYGLWAIAGGGTNRAYCSYDLL
ncbi:hypothetical protein [Ferrovibrio terrae]|uniref:hypothetical protein n=1 Tax=Ferrovibrio terrae TaxID=2594003 RepID=UPI003137AFB6